MPKIIVNINQLTELQYDDFKKYEVDPETIGYYDIPGINHKFIFPNGYGASVIKHGPSEWYSDINADWVDASYGYNEDLFELAVLKRIDDEDYELCYDTPITDDVLGYLSNEQVLEVLERIKNL